MKIGSYTLPSRLLLAPLSGCADLSFRLIAREHGCRFCFLEMVDAVSLLRRQKKTLTLLKAIPEDTPIAAQILGSDPRIVIAAALVLLEYAPSIPFLDLNAACPAKKVLKKRAGAFLLTDPKRLFAIVETLTATLPIPVTVKMRVGCGETTAVGVAVIARECEKRGAAAFFVHGRTQEQQYAGMVDYEAVRTLREAVSVPVFGSGDVLSPETAGRMLDETGCAGVLVARGAMGNPWIFQRTEEFLGTGKVPGLPSFRERMAVASRHIALIERHKDLPPSGKVGFMRKTALWYLKGFPEASRVRTMIVSRRSAAEIIDILDNLHPSP